MSFVPLTHLTLADSGLVAKAHGCTKGSGGSSPLPHLASKEGHTKVALSKMIMIIINPPDIANS
jgi:hypothetical protein